MNQQSDAAAGERHFFSAPGRAMVWTGVLVFLSVGYFQNSRPGWNANSQFALTCALVERGTLRIDAYHDKPVFYTEDKAFFRGHYYCDKSPVTAFLGVPAFWAASTLVRGVLNRPLSYPAARAWTIWIVEGLAAAALAAMTAALLMRRGVTPGRAALGGFFWIVATPLMPYAVVFFNYLPACALALGGFMMIERLWRGGGESAARGMRLFLGGVLLGLAAWTLNTLALVGLILTMGVLAAPAPGWRARLGRLAAWGVGGLIGVAGHFIYTRLVFGAWGSPYVYEADSFFREQMARGLMGATRPRLGVAWLISLHPFQGLFLLFPLVSAALAGCVAGLLRKRGPGRLEGAMALAVLAGLLLYNSAYFMWWGGSGYAPRHLIPSLTLLAVGLVPWLGGTRRWPGWLLLGIALAGVALNLPAVAVNPQHPIAVDQELLMIPERVAHWPIPLLDLHHYFWVRQYADANWGRALGLRGPASLAPLVGLWAVALALLACDRPAWRRESEARP